MRPTYAIIDLSCIRENITSIKKSIGTTPIMAVVKADAYGHGMKEVSKSIEDIVDWFGVAITEEGVILRESGIKKPILVFDGMFKNEGEVYYKFNLTPVISDEQHISELLIFFRKKRVKIPIHIKIDTGMGRLGFLPNALKKLSEKINDNKIIVEGILSHLAFADLKDRQFVKNQLETLKMCSQYFKNLKYIHIANTASCIDPKLKNELKLNIVRPGLGIYGIYPSKGLSGYVKLSPALTLKTEILSVRELPKGRGISYGHTFKLSRKSRIAVLPIGYGDGFLRANSNRGYVIINDKIAPVIGAVCMDLTMVDITDIKGVNVGDEAIIIGRCNKKTISAEEVAENSGTIPYEVLCLIGKRVRRLYV